LRFEQIDNLPNALWVGNCFTIAHGSAVDRIG